MTDERQDDSDNWDDIGDDTHWTMLEVLVRQVWSESLMLLLERGAFDPEATSVTTTPEPSVQNVRGLARLVASSVQLVHSEIQRALEFDTTSILTIRTCDGFGMPGTQFEHSWRRRRVDGSNGFDGWSWSGAEENDEFVQVLLRVLAMIPSASWDQLTPARRICLAADLGEILRLSLDPDSAEVCSTDLAATVLVQVCAGHNGLLDVAQIAGAALGARWGALFFEQYIESCRTLSRRLRRGEPQHFR